MEAPRACSDMSLIYSKYCGYGIGLLKFIPTRICPKCGHKEVVQAGSDRGPVLRNGLNFDHCDESNWIFKVEIELNDSGREIGLGGLQRA